MAGDRVQADEADRNVDEEDQAPVKVLDDQSARQRTREGTDEGWDGAASEWVPGERFGQSKPATMLMVRARMPVA